MKNNTEKLVLHPAGFFFLARFFPRAFSTFCGVLPVTLVPPGLRTRRWRFDSDRRDAGDMPFSQIFIYFSFAESASLGSE